MQQKADPNRCFKKKTSISLHQSLLLIERKPQTSHQKTNRYQHFGQNSPITTKSVRFTQNALARMEDRNSSTISLIDSQDNYEKDELIYFKNQHQNLESLKNLIQKKVFVGSGFSLDMSDFFRFKQKKEDFFSHQSGGKGIARLITGGHLAWFILFYSVCNAAIMPAWIMSIKANKILRISWRFFLQAIFIIPFILYEKRTGNESVKKKYTLKYIFALEGLKKVYLSSIGTTIWFTIILSCFQWTYISHSLFLGSLSNFFLSINRFIHHQTHQLEPGGQICVFVGIIFTLADAYLFKVEENSKGAWAVVNSYYLTRKPQARLIADIAALAGSFILSRFSQKTADLKSYYPPFLSMFLINTMVSIHVLLSAFYINGATFDRDTDFGVFALFTDQHFGGFFYMAVILSFGTYLSFTLISKLFTDPIIPALAMTLEPLFATFFLNLASVQKIPGPFSIYGYIFLICGLFLILIGQFLIQKDKQFEEKRSKIVNQMKTKIVLDQIEKHPIKDQNSQFHRKKVHKHLLTPDKKCSQIKNDENAF